MLPCMTGLQALTDPEVDDAAVDEGLHELEGDAHDQQRQRPGAGRVEAVVPLLEQHPAAWERARCDISCSK